MTGVDTPRPRHEGTLRARPRGERQGAPNRGAGAAPAPGHHAQARPARDGTPGWSYDLEIIHRPSARWGSSDRSKVSSASSAVHTSGSPCRL